MTRKTLWILLLVGYLAMVWCGATGDTGPMGWLKALQQHWPGGYSRKLSFIVFCFGTVVLSSPLLLMLILAPPPKPPAAGALADARPDPGSATASETSSQTASAWKTAALRWSVPIALSWAATFVNLAAGAKASSFSAGAPCWHSQEPMSSKVERSRPERA